MAVRCIECGSFDLDEDFTEDDYGDEISEYECLECGLFFDEIDVEEHLAEIEDNDC